MAIRAPSELTMKKGFDSDKKEDENKEDVYDKKNDKDKEKD